MYARTPFRQLAKLYSSILSATESLKQIRASNDDREDKQRQHAEKMREVLRENEAQAAARFSHQAFLAKQHSGLEMINTLRALRAEIAATMPDSPILAGWNSYAQCDEDGIIRECLRRIGEKTTLSKTFIEIGAADGMENNTHQLLLDGFRGCWAEGDPAKIGTVNHALGGERTNALLAKQCFVTLGTISMLVYEFKEFLGTDDIDFFTYDTDGNDAYLVLEALRFIKPKLICVEYNAKFPPPTALKIDYDEGHLWAGDDFYGATLQTWVDILEGYKLVSCNLSGVNAFFVRNDLAGPFTNYTPAQHYQPARHALVANKDHPASLKWLRQVATVRSPLK